MTFTLQSLATKLFEGQRRIMKSRPDLQLLQVQSHPSVQAHHLLLVCVSIIDDQTAVVMPTYELLQPRFV